MANAAGIVDGNQAEVPGTATGNPDDCVGQCMFWTQGDGNCVITYCYHELCLEEHNYLYFRSLYSHYQTVETHCKPNAGGTAPGNIFWGLYATNLGSAPGGPRARLLESATSSEGGLIEGTISAEDFSAYLNATSEEAEEEQRSVKRQESLEILSLWRNVPKDGDNGYQVTEEMPSGSDITTSIPTTDSISLETSASMGVSFFEIFSAEAGISVTNEYSETIAESMTTVVGQCDSDYGILYWIPLYNVYRVRIDGVDGDIVTVHIPSELNGYARGSWRTVCVG